MLAAGVVELLPDDLQDNLSGAGAVQLNQEDALPSTQLELSIDNGDGLAGTHEQVLAVGVAVGALVFGHVDGADGEVVVLVVSVGRGDTGQEALHVFMEEGLVLADLDSRSGVLGVDDDEAILYVGALSKPRYVLGNIDKLRGALGLQYQPIGDGYHIDPQVMNKLGPTATQRQRETVAHLRGIFNILIGNGGAIFVVRRPW